MLLRLCYAMPGTATRCPVLTQAMLLLPGRGSVGRGERSPRVSVLLSYAAATRCPVLSCDIRDCTNSVLTYGVSRVAVSTLALSLSDPALHTLHLVLLEVSAYAPPTPSPVLA
eukprot:2047435-Rhodomonas_salina.1